MGKKEVEVRSDKEKANCSNCSNGNGDTEIFGCYGDAIMALVARRKDLQCRIQTFERTVKLRRENDGYEEMPRDTASILNCQINTYNGLLQSRMKQCTKDKAETQVFGCHTDAIMALAERRKNVQCRLRTLRTTLKLQKENDRYEEMLRDTASILNNQINMYNSLIQPKIKPCLNVKE